LKKTSLFLKRNDESRECPEEESIPTGNKNEMNEMTEGVL
jgi:hypothetical protein